MNSAALIEHGWTYFAPDAQLIPQEGGAANKASAATPRNTAITTSPEFKELIEGWEYVEYDRPITLFQTGQPMEYIYSYLPSVATTQPQARVAEAYEFYQPPAFNSSADAKPTSTTTALNTSEIMKQLYWRRLGSSPTQCWWTPNIYGVNAPHIATMQEDGSPIVQPFQTPFPSKKQDGSELILLPNQLPPNSPPLHVFNVRITEASPASKFGIFRLKWSTYCSKSEAVQRRILQTHKVTYNKRLSEYHSKFYLHQPNYLERTDPAEMEPSTSAALAPEPSAIPSPSSSPQQPKFSKPSLHPELKDYSKEGTSYQLLTVHPEHALTFRDRVYDGGYTCDLCMQDHCGPAYHCMFCNFDSCLPCVAQKLKEASGLDVVEDDGSIYFNPPAREELIRQYNLRFGRASNQLAVDGWFDTDSSSYEGIEWDPRDVNHTRRPLKRRGLFFILVQQIQPTKDANTPHGRLTENFFRTKIFNYTEVWNPANKIYQQPTLESLSRHSSSLGYPFISALTFQHRYLPEQIASRAERDAAQRLARDQADAARVKAMEDAQTKVRAEAEAKRAELEAQEKRRADQKADLEIRQQQLRERMAAAANSSAGGGVVIGSNVMINGQLATPTSSSPEPSTASVVAAAVAGVRSEIAAAQAKATVDAADLQQRIALRTAKSMEIANKYSADIKFLWSPENTAMDLEQKKAEMALMVATYQQNLAELNQLYPIPGHGQ